MGLIFFSVAAPSLLLISTLYKSIKRQFEAQTLLQGLRDGLNASAIIASTDEKGRIQFANKRFEDISGYSEEELLGKDHRILNSAHHDKAFFKSLWASIKSGAIWRGEIKNKRKNGAYYWVDSYIVPLRDTKGKIQQFVSIRYDISDRKNAEENLDVALQNASMAAWSFDLRSGAAWRSKNHDQLLGYEKPQESWTHNNFLAHVIQEDRERAEMDFLLSANRHHFQSQYRVRKANSEETYWIEIIGQTQLDESKRPLRIVGTIRDITEQKQLESQLRDAITIAEHATRTKSVFLANMSHELRTPLNGIIGMANLLADGVLDPKARDRVRILQNSSHTLLHIINDLLDFSKLEADKMELENHPFDLETSMADIVALLQPKADEKSIFFELKLPSPKYIHVVQGDITRIKQVLSNLISNAIKFTPRGGVTVELKAPAQQSTPSGSGHFEIRVTDSGIGIPEHLKSRLFLSFSQVDASTTRRFGGSGLGLAICKGIVEKMGGEIGVESQENQGSTFWFRFPANFTTKIKDHSATSSTPVQPLFDPHMASQFPLRILVAEDNPTNQVVIEGLLGKFGYAPTIAADGSSAVSLCRDHIYDLIFMDCHMPNMDGFEATKAILADEHISPKPRIIALSAGINSENLDRCREAGMDGFLAKPISIPELIQTLRGRATKECPALSREGAQPQPLPHASSPSPTPVPTAPAPFDQQSLLAQFQGMEDLLQETIHSFKSSLPLMLKGLEEAALGTDPKTLERAAHSLKGAVSNFHAPLCVQIAKNLEEKGQRGDFSEVPKLISELKSSLEDFMTALDAFANQKRAA